MYIKHYIKLERRDIMKSKGVAYLLLIFLGFLGAHRFYIGKIGTGILYLFTGGFAGLGVLIDLFTLGTQVDTYNALHNPRNQGQNINVNVQTAAPPQNYAPAINSAPDVKKSPERVILDLPDDRPLSLKDIVKMTPLEIDEAENAIQKLISKGLAKEVVETDGSIKYNFS